MVSGMAAHIPARAPARTSVSTGHTRLGRLGLAFVLYFAAGACANEPHVDLNASGVSSSASDAWIQLGDSVQLRADFARTDANGCFPNGQHSSVTEPNRFSFASGSPAVGDVRAGGMFLARSVGTTDVTASADGATSLRLRMHVVPRIAVARFAVRTAALRVRDTLGVPFTLTDTAGGTVGPDLPAGAITGAYAIARVLDVAARPPGRVIRVIGTQPGVTSLTGDVSIIRGVRPPPDTIPVSVTRGPGTAP